jgi:hypothetical protein
MNKITFVDTIYQEVLKSLKETDYNLRLKELMDIKFGTSNYYSEAFKSYGWLAEDVILNDPILKEEGIKRLYDNYNDIIYFQDLSVLSSWQLKELKKHTGALLVAQHSCPWAGDEQIKAFDHVFTSFPHYIPRIAQLGVGASFLQIGFGGPSIVSKCLESNPTHSQIYPISFVGGIGRHWNQGNQLLETIASKFDEFRWWGYGAEHTQNNLKSKYQGEAWGLDMYKIYTQSKIVINRHGEVAEGYSNNMRMFEVTSCGALLMTENSKNIKDYFEPGKECIIYNGIEDLISEIYYFMNHEDERAVIASMGQKRTLENHCYNKILKPIERELNGMLKR